MKWHTHIHRVENSDFPEDKLQIIFQAWRTFNYKYKFDIIYYCDLQQVYKIQI